MLSKIALLLFCCTIANGANILAIIPSPLYSHQSNFWPMWKELSQRGHQVKVLTPVPLNDPQLTNLTEYDMSHAAKHMEKLYEKLHEYSSMELIKNVRLTAQKIRKDFYASEALKQITNSGQRFDLVIVEVFYPEFLIYGDIFNCPTILVSSLDTSSTINAYMGNQIHGVALPEFMLPFYGQLTFPERLSSVLSHVVLRLFPGLRSNTDLWQGQFGEAAPPTVDELLQKVDMLFLNTHPLLTNVRAVGPSTISYGGLFHIRDPKPLPKDLQNFLDNAKNGAIYFSLGSTVKSKNLEGPKLDTILKTLSELPYQILWKFEDDLPNVPKNVKIIKWGPQQDILRHPNIKAFITQAGLQSLEEAIHNDIPMVVLPVYGDQTANAKRLHEKGLAIMVEHKPVLSGEKFKHAILEVINNLKYKDNVKHMHRLILDQPMTGIEKVVWWTEYVIRNKGAKHLRPNILNLPLYQYYYLDIWAFILAVLVVLYQATKYTIRLLRRCLLMPLLRLMSPRASRVNSHKKRR